MSRSGRGCVAALCGPGPSRLGISDGAMCLGTPPPCCFGTRLPVSLFFHAACSRRGDVPIQRARYWLQKYCHGRDALSPSTIFSLPFFATLLVCQSRQQAAHFVSSIFITGNPLCHLRVPKLTAGAAVTSRALGWGGAVPQGSPVKDALIPGPSFDAAARPQRSTSILTLSVLPCGHSPLLIESFVE